MSKLRLAVWLLCVSTAALIVVVGFASMPPYSPPSKQPKTEELSADPLEPVQVASQEPEPPAPAERPTPDTVTAPQIEEPSPYTSEAGPMPRRVPLAAIEESEEFPEPKYSGKAAVEELDERRDKRPLDAPDTSVSRAGLGKMLFHDKNLSGNRSRSCATCHLPDNGFASKEPLVGFSGKPIGRHAPSLINVVYASSLFVDGRAKSLEEQCRLVLANPEEMGSSDKLAAERVRESKRYSPIFARLYDEGITPATVVDALCEYERTLVAKRGRFDAYLNGEKNPLTAAEVRGFNLFRGRAQCYRCHFGVNLSDGRFHNTGVGTEYFDRFLPDKTIPPGKPGTSIPDGKGGRFLIPRDFGRYSITGNLKDHAAFRTPTLRGIGSHSPYMHDGSQGTLEDVIRHYNRGGIPNPGLDKDIFPLELTPREQADLAAFLRVL